MVALLQSEAGGHRWQRVPPSERRGRVHTSTVTVALVFSKDGQQKTGIDSRDVEEFVQRGSGPGGQHRNKTESCVRLRHNPTGIDVRIDMRSQHRSRALAKAVLEDRVMRHERHAHREALNADRALQIGSGMRGDKIRTYRQQDDVVIDHRTGRKARLSDVLRGKLDKLIM